MEHKLKQTVKQNKVDFIKFVVFVIIMIGLAVLTIRLLPWVISLKDESGREAFQNYIHSKGAFGVLILIGVQVLQVVVAFIPGEPIEVLAGLLYGTFGGYVLCAVGIMIGTVIIYYTVRGLGMGFITRVVGEGKLDKFKFLHDAKRLEMIVFFLFFIPGTPKDLLTYFIPATKMKPMTFFILVTVARIPSIVSSTFAGASIGEGKWLQTVLIFLVIGVISLIGIIFNEKILKIANARREKIHNRKKK
ncbi:MAG: VTT domain-containing protein [Oscillospiraceae bacterium]